MVVASAGNDTKGGQPIAMANAPGNDPFAITVGALDLHNRRTPSARPSPPWSNWGYTFDGFAKPELSAPGRAITGPVPSGSTLANTKQFKNQVLRTPEGTYMTLSGTSLSAPIVSGIVADLLALHPSLAPDRVKGALMLRAQMLPKTHSFSGGVGEVFAPDAAAIQSPPNPNRGLDQFLIPDPSGDGMVFDESPGVTSRSTRRRGTRSPGARAGAAPPGRSSPGPNVSWSNVSWSDVSWSDVSWSDVSWNDVSWDNVYRDVD